MSNRKIKVKFHIPDDHRLHFVTSVWGGVTPKGMVEIHFLHDRPPLPKMSFDTLDAENNVVTKEIDTAGYDVVRSVQTGVIMDLESAKSFLTWLQEKVERLESDTKETENAK